MEGTNDVGRRAAEALVGAPEQMPAGSWAARRATLMAVGSSGGPHEATYDVQGSMTAREGNQNMTQALTVVVTGSAGRQGGVVARGLVERGHKVRAVTRPQLKPDEVAARAGWSPDLGGGR
jgi:NmrA-like family